MQERRSTVAQCPLAITPRLMTVREAAAYMNRSEKAIRHMYEKGILTPIRIDARVQIDPREIEELIEKAKQNARFGTPLM